MTGHSYLNTLSADELFVIIRYVSNRPDSQFWHAYLRGRSRETLFTKNGPFANAIREHFTHALVHETHGKDCGVYVSGNDKFGVRLFQDFGNSFTRVTISDYGLSTLPTRHDIIEAFAENSDSLRQLNLFLDRESIVKYSNRSFFVKHVTLLEHFRLWFRSSEGFRLKLPAFTNLLVLDVNGPRLEHVVSALQSSRETLEEVNLEGTCTHWIPVIAVLRTCRNLRRIELDGGVPLDDYVTLLESFGSKLEHAVVKRMSYEMCERVVRACPNLQCEIWIDAMNIETMVVLGKQVRQLSIQNPEIGDWTRMETAAKVCTGITEIKCLGRSMNGGSLQTLFDTPKKNLERVHLVISGFHVTAKFLQSMSLATGNLRALNLTAHLFADVDELVGLLAANPKLVEVRLAQRQRVSQCEATQKCVKIVRGLHGHQDVQNIKVYFDVVVTNRKQLADVFREECKAFRFRPVEVTVFGRIYSHYGSSR